jgi:dCMP deaminase
VPLEPTVPPEPTGAAEPAVAAGQILLYLPVLHAGYQALLQRHPDAEVLVLGASFADEFPVLRKEIRALDPAVAVGYLAGAGRRARVVERGELPGAVTAARLAVPDEELLRSIVDTYGVGTGREVLWERSFLRWDREWAQAGRPAGYDGSVSADELARTRLRQAFAEAQLSSDWWRQVGAVAVRDGSVLDRAHNEHQPTPYTPYLDGDPRNEFSRGVRADLSTALHAEAAIVARAARRGASLAGADLYVSTFPCPTCARLVAEAGFRRVYFAGPYAVLAGDDVLRAAGVELIWVDVS